MSHVFVYPNSNISFFVQFAVSEERIIVRTFFTHKKRPSSISHDALVMSKSDVINALSMPVSPIMVTRATPHGSYLRLCDLPGSRIAAPAVMPDVLLEEVSQTALIADAALLGSGALSERADWVVFANSNGQLYSPVNRTLKSYAARAPKIAIYGELQCNAVLNVHMPFRDVDFSRAAIYVNANPAIGLVYEADAAYAIEAGGLKVDGLPLRPAGDPPFRWPELRLRVPEALPADGFAEIAVQLVDGAAVRRHPAPARRGHFRVLCPRLHPDAANGPDRGATAGLILVARPGFRLG